MNKKPDVSKAAKKILIIDDDKIFSKVLKDAMKVHKDGKYTTAHAVDGEEGLRKAKEEKPDLIVLDVVMPNVGGLEFLKNMKSDKDIPKIPVLVTSQYSDMEKISAATELGIKGYLVKADHTLDEIIKKIEDVLEGE